MLSKGDRFQRQAMDTENLSLPRVSDEDKLKKQDKAIHVWVYLSKATLKDPNSTFKKMHKMKKGIINH